MCGLIGTIGFKDNTKLDLKTISHRGPDSSGKWNSSENEFPSDNIGTLCKAFLKFFDGL